MTSSGSTLHNTPASSTLSLLQSTSNLRKGALVLGGNLLLIASAHLAMPHALTPVPSTLQTFAVLFLALALGPTLSAATVCAYLLEGTLGAPVFAPPFSAGGLAHLLGPTGGYLLAYLPACLLSGFLYNHLRARAGRRPAALLACLAAELPILLLGSAWLAVEANLSFAQALALGATPFLAGEALKLLFALLCFEAASRLTSKE